MLLLLLLLVLTGLLCSSTGLFLGIDPSFDSNAYRSALPRRSWQAPRVDPPAWEHGVARIPQRLAPIYKNRWR